MELAWYHGGWNLRLGHHAILDGQGVGADLLNDPESLTKIMHEGVLKSGATVLSTHFHQFQPVGVTVVIILAESHATIHTYPEHGEYMADIFTCGDVDPTKAADFVGETLGGEHRVTMVSRGF